ncbi:hypothetical protein OIU78_026385 [Salix suchowensis]|nr:hypothetical protein OIU78_026385 [Salix suchowensis]
MTKPRLPTSTPDQERNVIYQRHWDQQSIAVKQQDNTRAPSQTITVIKPLSQEGQSQRQFRSHQRRPQQQESSAFTFEQRIQTQNETFVSRNRTPPRAKINNLQSRRASSATNAISGVTDFVALNRMRKRRTVSVNARVESTGFANPMSTRQGNTKSYSNELPLKGDALSTILEQKLKELASQEEDEMISGGSHPKRSTAMILQELIFALTANQPMSPRAHVFNADKTCEFGSLPNLILPNSRVAV